MPEEFTKVINFTAVCLRRMQREEHRVWLNYYYFAVRVVWFAEALGDL
jgi:hypothetical protein